MLVVVADSNIYISALHFGGTPLRLIDAARSGDFQLAISDPLLTEIQRVLALKFQWSADMLEEATGRILRFAILVQPSVTIDAVASDPDDNRVLECAVAAGARIIVTGDDDLLRLGTYDGIEIMKAGAFMLRL